MPTTGKRIFPHFVDAIRYPSRDARSIRLCSALDRVHVSALTSDVAVAFAVPSHLPLPPCRHSPRQKGFRVPAAPLACAVFRLVSDQLRRVLSRESVPKHPVSVQTCRQGTVLLPHLLPHRDLPTNQSVQSDSFRVAQRDSSG